jgi:hypothetical protein
VEASLAGNALDLSAIIKWYRVFGTQRDRSAAVRLIQARYLSLTSRKKG